MGGMQGKLIFAILVSAVPGTAALAGEPQRRQPCTRQEQVQQRRTKPQGCLVTRSIPAVVDPVPMFIL